MILTKKKWIKTGLDRDKNLKNLPNKNQIVLLKFEDREELAVFREKELDQIMGDRPKYYFELIDRSFLNPADGIEWQKTDRTLYLDPKMEREREQARLSSNELFQELFYSKKYDIEFAIYMLKMLQEKVEMMRRRPDDAIFSMQKICKNLQIALEVERDLRRSQ